MLLILILNSVGDRILPCGIPCSCSKVSDNVEPIRTLKDLSDKKFDIKFGNRPLRPISCKSFYDAIFPCRVVRLFEIKKYCDTMFFFNKCITNKRF